MGLFYVVQDEEIDFQFLFLVCFDNNFDFCVWCVLIYFQDVYFFMIVMIIYLRLVVKVWWQVFYFELVLVWELCEEEMECFDQEIIEWYDFVLDEVKVWNWDKEWYMVFIFLYNLQRLWIWIYFCFNQVS